MKKRLLLFLMSMMMLSLAACTSGETETNRKDRGSKTEKDSDKDDENDEDDDADTNDDPVDILDGGQTTAPVYPVIDDSLDLIELYTYSSTVYGFSEDNNEEYAYVTYNTAYTGETVGDEYDGVTNALIEFNNTKKESAEASRDTYVEEAKDMVESGAGTSYFPLYDVSYQYIMRSDERVVSLAYYNESFFGGAHGMYGWIGYNFDPVTGSQLKITDVVSDVDYLNEVLLELIMEYDGSLSADSVDIMLDEYKGMIESGEGDYKWSIDYSGITVYFNPYELGSYAQGAQLIRIRFEDYPVLFSDFYAVRPSAYITGGEVLKGVYCDLDNDGEEEQVYISSTQGDEFDVLDVSIGIGDDIYYLEDITGFDINTFIVHQENGTEYLMLEVEGINAYSKTMLISFEDGSYNICDVIESGLGGIILSDYPDDFIYAHIIPNDPSYFMLISKFDILSSFSGRMWYSINADGTFERYADIYDVTPSYVLVSTKDITAYKTDDYGYATSDQVVLPAGTNMEITGTDGYTYVNVCADGEYYSICIEVDGYDQRIDGVSIFDIFEELYFAG